ncbi:unnamed protein product [Haemonchus placei]|uniref:Uncharacterized protein n=1 Tax=Haemonchus placei TaxID=6290 RepID=A0A0N4W714_HAEPC|nr:unnamed protein product [Haemonchus placei]
MSGVFRRRDPNASSQVDSHLILDDGPIEPSDYQIREHVWREPAGMDSNYDGYRRGSAYSMCPVHGSTHSIWRPVRQESRESRAIFEGGYRSDCPVHGLPPPLATSECVIHSESFHTAILNTEHDVIVVPPEPPGEPVQTPKSPYEEPAVFQQRVQVHQGDPVPEEVNVVAVVRVVGGDLHVAHSTQLVHTADALHRVRLNYGKEVITESEEN